MRTGARPTGDRSLRRGWLGFCKVFIALLFVLAPIIWVSDYVVLRGMRAEPPRLDCSIDELDAMIYGPRGHRYTTAQGDATWERVRGHSVCWWGEVANVTGPTLGRYTVTLQCYPQTQGSDVTSRVMRSVERTLLPTTLAIFPEKRAREVAHLGRGEYIQVRGILSDRSDITHIGYSLQDCTVVQRR